MCSRNYLPFSNISLLYTQTALRWKLHNHNRKDNKRFVSVCRKQTVSKTDIAVPADKMSATIIRSVGTILPAPISKNLTAIHACNSSYTFDWRLFHTSYSKSTCSEFNSGNRELSYCWPFFLPRTAIIGLAPNNPF